MTPSFAQPASFRNAPASASAAANPYAGSAAASAAGKKLYAQDCAQCHGNNLQGMGPAPALDTAGVRKAKPGELFWFISTGKLTSGMPSWSNLPKQQRWQIVTFLQSRSNERTAAK
jgi:mono/diheme cytochrome c family protein